MKLDDLLSFTRRKGLVWQSAELYGGMAGFYDYGHLGAGLKRRWEDLWLDYFLGLHDNYHLIDSANVMPEESLKASGHVAHFTDILVECQKCHASYRADTLIEEKTGKSAEDLTTEETDRRIAETGLKCAKCGGAFSKSSPFNMMFPLQVGARQDEHGYLRPETAQGVYLNFNREFELLRKRLPMGLAIIGRAYRNEIAPRQVLYRLRELIQAELQIFFDPEKFDREVNTGQVDDYELNVSLVEERDMRVMRTVRASELYSRLPPWYVYHMAKIQEFYIDGMKVPAQKFRFREKSEKERAFYNRIHFDIEVELESLGGFREVAGIHYRGDYDLTCHQKGSAKSLEVNIEGKKFIPHVLELSFGVDRNVWALLDLHYSKQGERTLFSIPSRLAPVQVGVFPLMARDGLDSAAAEIAKTLRAAGLRVFYDESGSIGRRYARMDESGTPFCVTVDYDSLEKKDATIRERDSARQVRVPIPDLASRLGALLCGKEVL